MYSPEVEPDVEIIIYCDEVVKTGNKPSVKWPMLLGMYKHYLTVSKDKGPWFQKLRSCLVTLFGKDTISHLDNVGGADDKL